MSGIRVVVVVALVARALARWRAAAANPGSTRPTRRRLQARKDAEKNKEPLPPEPTKPDEDRPFILDGLIK